MVEASVAELMLERQPSLTIRTKIDPQRMGEGVSGRSGATRGVNFDNDGNTPRSGGNEDMLGSIDSGTPHFFKDAFVDDGGLGRTFASKYSFDLAESPSKPLQMHDGAYFNNNELAELLTIVHGGAQYAQVGEAGSWSALNTPTLAEVDRLSNGAKAFENVKPSASKRKAPLSAAKDVSQVRSHKKKPDPTEPALTAEEEAMRKMKSFSTRGSTLRTVEDKELLDSLVNMHDQPLTAAFKKACLEHNARAEQLNHLHEMNAGTSAGRNKVAEVDEDGVPRSRNWTHEEDTLVKSLVEKHGAKKWALIADRLRGKTQKQVYARWRDYLQPGLTTRAWADFEKDHLIKIQDVIGNQWAVLARLMPGRSPNAIKNKFHATKRRIDRQGPEDDYD